MPELNFQTSVKGLKRRHNRIKNRIKNGHGKPGDEQRLARLKRILNYD